MRNRKEECGVLEADSHFIYAVSIRKRKWGDGILNILFNRCTDNQNNFFALRGGEGFSERNIASTTS